MVETVHEHQVPIILQVAHNGAQHIFKAASEHPDASSRKASPWRNLRFREKGVPELSPADIEQLINAFVAAIVRASQAGFDGVQLHAAHGYLLSSFLSPYSNRRRDEWGGSTEKRFRILKEILSRNQAQLGDYPILIKINGSDARPGGMTPPEAVKIARLLEEAGCAAIEVSCGTEADGFNTIGVEYRPRPFWNTIKACKSSHRGLSRSCPPS